MDSGAIDWNRSRIAALAARFTQLDPARCAMFDEPAADRPGETTPVLFAEFHGERVDDVRALRRDAEAALAETGPATAVEIVRAGWLPRRPDGDVALDALAARHEAAVQARRRASLEVGTFAALEEAEQDAFAYFGTGSRIRTPCEITHPSCITVGNWVSLGRYGKIVMLPGRIFAGTAGRLARLHYPELAARYDFSGQAEGRPADLVFGDGTSLGDRYFIICTQSIEFGHHVMTASDLFVSDCHHTFEGVELPPILLPPTKGRPVRIGDHAWIGIRCSILEGVTLGRHAVVAAHSVVKDDVPPYTLVAGTPARVVRDISPPG